MVAVPLGTACTAQLAKAKGLVLFPNLHYAVHNALPVWLGVLIGLIRRVPGHLFSKITTLTIMRTI